MWLCRSLLSALVCVLMSARPASAGGQFHVHEPARKAVKTVALLPMRVDPTLLDSIAGAEQVIQRIEAGVEQRFRAAGYTVVPPARYKDFWDVEQPKAGALYHPFNGERNEDVYKKVRANVMRRLSETYPHDAVVEMSFAASLAEMNEGVIEWDDVVESAAGYSAIGDFLLGPNRNNEMLQVLSLRVMLLDRNGEPMYTGEGGLQPMQRSPFFGSYYNLKSVPLFNDPRREARAIDMALGPWLMTPKDFKAAQKKAHARLPLPKTASPGPEPAPFDRNAFFARSPVIAVTPIVLPEFNGDVRAARAQYDQFTVNMLRNMGYRVVPAIEFLKAWNNAITNSFGLYDEYTGRAIPGARDELMKQVMTELREKHGVDALLTGAVTRRMVSFEDGTANWDGRIYVEVPGSVVGGVNRLARTFGSVPALSLNVSLLDIDGKRMVGGAGGIQIIRRYTQGQFVEIDQSEWFKDRDSNVQAVYLALRPLDKSEKEKKAEAKAAEKKADN